MGQCLSTRAAYIPAPSKFAVAIHPIQTKDIRSFCTSQPYKMRPWIINRIELSPNPANIVARQCLNLGEPNFGLKVERAAKRSKANLNIVLVLNKTNLTGSHNQRPSKSVVKLDRMEIRNKSWQLQRPTSERGYQDSRVCCRMWRQYSCGSREYGS